MRIRVEEDTPCLTSTDMEPGDVWKWKNSAVDAVFLTVATDHGHKVVLLGGVERAPLLVSSVSQTFPAVRLGRLVLETE